MIPLLAGTGALSFNPSGWSDGYFAEVGMLIGGSWLKWWIQAAAAMSNLGLFEAEMSSDAFQLLGMSEIGMLPAMFASRSVKMNAFTLSPVNFLDICFLLFVLNDLTVKFSGLNSYFNI